MNSKHFFALGGSLLIGFAALGEPIHAESDSDLSVRLERAEARLVELEAKQNDSWMTERRTEEFKTLIAEVLADADTRASMLQGQSLAGHNGKNFYLTDASNSFLLQVAGQVQIRHIYNNRDDDSATAAQIDEDEGGFQVSRAKLQFSGHVADPRLNYSIMLASDRNTNNVSLEDVTVSYQMYDWLKVEGGRGKLPFLREELTSSSSQLAAERSSLNEFFTTDRGEGLWLHIHNSESDWIKGVIAISDGANSGNVGGGNDFDQDRTDFSVTGRADIKVSGDWGQMNDFSAWSGEPTAVFLGSAIHWEVGEAGDNAFVNDPDYLAWTVDASFENEGLNLYTAYVGTEVDYQAAAPPNDEQHNGWIVQGGYMVIPDKFEPFARYEYINVAGIPDDVHILTVGGNWYLNKHAAKITVDLVYAMDALNTINNSVVGASVGLGQNGTSSGLGLRPDDGNEDGQIALRAQLQLLF